MKAARKKEWFDDETLWRDLYPFMFSPDRFAAARFETQQAVRLSRPPGKRVLDLCCGPGRCAVPLAKRGFVVTGVDRTKFLLNKARALARRFGVRIEWVQADDGAFH